MNHHGHSHKGSDHASAHQNERPSSWKRPHHDWRFWCGLALIFFAMFIYLATEDLSWRLLPQPAQPKVINGHG